MLWPAMAGGGGAGEGMGVDEGLVGRRVVGLSLGRSRLIIFYGSFA